MAAEIPSTPGVMHCLGCDYMLDGLPSRECPECGRAFDPDDVTTYRLVPQPVRLNDPVRLAQLPISDAVVVRMRLEDKGIAAALHEERGGVIGYMELPRGSIWVEREDEVAARAIMNEPAEQVAHSPWTCAKCGERIAGQFAICWNCGAERAAQ